MSLPGRLLRVQEQPGLGPLDLEQGPLGLDSRRSRRRLQYRLLVLLVVLKPDLLPVLLADLLAVLLDSRRLRPLVCPLVRLRFSRNNRPLDRLRGRLLAP